MRTLAGFVLVVSFALASAGCGTEEHHIGKPVTPDQIQNLVLSDFSGDEPLVAVLDFDVVSGSDSTHIRATQTFSGTDNDTVVTEVQLVPAVGASDSWTLTESSDGTTSQVTMVHSGVQTVISVPDGTTWTDPSVASLFANIPGFDAVRFVETTDNLVCGDALDTDAGSAFEEAAALPDGGTACMVPTPVPQTFGPEAPPDPTRCNPMAKGGPRSCDYYDCLEMQYMCGANGYLQKCGKKVCASFMRQRNTPNQTYRDFITYVMYCLQSSLDTWLRNCAPNATCDQIKDQAIDVHGACFQGDMAAGGPSLCTLSKAGKFAFVRAILGAGIVRVDCACRIASQILDLCAAQIPGAIRRFIRARCP